MNTVRIAGPLRGALLSVTIATIVYTLVACTSSQQPKGRNIEQVAKNGGAEQKNHPLPLSPEEAFKKGVDAIQGHINLFDSKWQVTFRRTASNNWFMTVSRFPKPGITEVKILIKDNGDVSVLPGL